MGLNSNGFNPSFIRRYIESRPTGASVVVVETDSGIGYLKGLGNASGPHALACELIGSMAADWLGLPTLDFALINVTSEDELPLAQGGFLQPGPAFISKKAEGFPWGGLSQALTKLVNSDDLTKLILLDTWTLNCDRFSVKAGQFRINRDNVFFVKTDTAKLRLVALDHTHSFTCGQDVSHRMNQITYVQDPRSFGAFPEFEEFWNPVVSSDALARLQTLTRQTASRFVRLVPAEWEVTEEARTSWIDFLVQRANWVAENAAVFWPNVTEIL